MKRAAARTPNPSRSRKKTAAPAPEPVEEKSPTPAAAGERNVSPLEGGLSTAAGVLFVVAALFPRTLRQLVFLGLGGGLLYRGMTGKCGVYSALGIDTARAPLLKQLNDKFIAPAASETAGS